MCSRTRPCARRIWEGRAVLLEVRNLEVSYGLTTVLKGVSLGVPEDGIVAMLGTNGAGKTTLLRTICGFVPVSGTLEMEVDEGGVFLDGERIDRLTPDRVVARGVCHVPEGREIFRDLSVEENLRMGGYTRGRDANSSLDAVYAHFPLLAERRHQRGETLSGGEQQMLAIGRALMGRPRLLMLDEPSLGLAPVVVEHIFAIIREIRRQGVAILLVEQNAELALEVADFTYVMETGKVMAEGSGEELRHNDVVREFYLGIADNAEVRSYADTKSYRIDKRWR